MINTLIEYLRDNVDHQITIDPWREIDKIPIFLNELYMFYEMKFLKRSCILLQIIDILPGLSSIKKHIRRVKTLADDHEIVLLFRNITRYRRKSLIENRIPFIIEDGQMFLPFLGLDLKQISDDVVKKSATFSASVQNAYLYFLYNRDAVVNTTSFGAIMGVTSMTASRILNELHHDRLIMYSTGGTTRRSKLYFRISDPEYFEKGKIFLRSPINQVVYVKSIPEGAFIAGQEALASLSMLNPPDYQIRAIGSRHFGKLNMETVTNEDMIKDERLVELQIWNYDPAQFSDNRHVDLVSLYASLKDENDERIKQTLDEIMRGKPWYTD